MAVSDSRLFVPVSSVDHIRGDAAAPVTLLEYGDFECPDCAVAWTTIEEVRLRMGEYLRFAYRHFPLVHVHPRAERAAEAAEAAGAQGRFWEMHDVLFANQDALEDDDLLSYAEALGIERRRFADELSSGAHLPRVREHLTSGARSGVSRTPALFINGAFYQGDLDVASLVVAIRRALG
jgi:protein-disulfide isomerase